MRKSLILLVLSLSLISIANVNAIDLVNQNRLSFEHILYISDISTTPPLISPGAAFVLDFNMTKRGSQFASDIVTRLSLPDKISTYNDITSNKKARLNPDESLSLKFNLIVSPDATEGVYKLPVIVNYVNYIGDDRQENETLTIIVSSKPNLFAEVKASEIYVGNEIGKISISIANNDLANIKFLTVELNESTDYDIISSNKVYVGDLNSDDTQGIDFRIKVNKALSEVILPLTLTYKDGMNNNYNQEIDVKMYIRTPGELGIKSNNTSKIIVILIIAVIAGIWLYRRNKNKKRKPAIFK